VGAVAGTPGTLPTNWSTLSTIAGITAEIVGTGTFGGITYIDIKLAGTASATGAYHLVFDANTAIAASTGQTWTSSAYLAAVAGSFANITSASLRCTERTIAGSFVGSAEASFTGITSNLSNNRIAVSRSLGATSAFVQGAIIVNVASGVAIDITLRVGLPQLEQGAFATSVIPTSTAAVTRSADVASITGSAFSSWYRQDEGTVFADGSTAALTPTTGFVSINSGTTTNRIEIRQGRTSPTVTGSSASIGWATVTGGPTLVASVSFKQAVGVQDASHGSSVGGGLQTATTAIGSISATQLIFGARDTQTAPTGGSSSTIRRVTFWPARLSNSTLQTLAQ
jgi:hypothetical protein